MNKPTIEEPEQILARGDNPPYEIFPNGELRMKDELIRVDIEALSARLHDVYQKEAHRRGDVRHVDSYADLSESTKEWDRVLARWIVANFEPMFDPNVEIPPA